MSFDEIWTTKDGQQIPVRDMTLSHVKNTLKMLIRQYTATLITRYGARYTSGINTETMTETEAREMLNQTCANRSYLRRLVAEKCFGPDVWKEWLVIENRPIENRPIENRPIENRPM